MIIKTNDYDSAYYNAIRNIKSSNEYIIFINGCFDIMHLGHIKMFKDAKNRFYSSSKLAHYMQDKSRTVRVVVGLNSDYSINTFLKKKHSLIMPEDYRANFVHEFVDDVIIFDEASPFRILLGLIPDAVIKGIDYKDQEFEEKMLLNDMGTRIFYYDSEIDISTTKIIEKVRHSEIKI